MRIIIIVVLVNSVDAFGSVPTGIRNTFVYVDLAIGTGRTSPTTALVSVD